VKRQVIVTDWKNGLAPQTTYEDQGPGRASSRPASSLDCGPYQVAGRETERGGRVRHAGVNTNAHERQR
jgi:hypothetical protein